MGISSHENDYRLVWAINNELKTQFVKTENLVKDLQGHNDRLEFSCFTFHDQERYLTFTLISNRCPDGFLFPELKNIDFLMRIQGEISDRELKEINQDIKSVPVISASFIMDPGKIKGISRILQV